MSKTPTIKRSSNYSMVKDLPGNRQINLKHVENLTDSIAKTNYLHLFPIILNEKKQVIDGQHRLLAAKSLELDFYYIIEPDLGLFDVQAINTSSRKWMLQDYLDSYLELGYDNYVELAAYMERFSVNLTAAIHLTKASDTRTFIAFKEGNFKILDNEVCERNLEYYKDLSEIVGDVSLHVMFIRACRTIFNHPEYDHEEMLQQIKRDNVIVRRMPTTNEYLRTFETIFNMYKSVNRVRFY